MYLCTSTFHIFNNSTNILNTAQGLAAGLQDMLDYKGDVEGDFMCSFTIGYTDMFGMSVTKELKKNGAEISVTNQNRQVKGNLHL